MKHKLIIDYLKNYGNISEKEEVHIRKYFIPMQALKKQTLINKNSDCNKLFFINNGLLRAYYINDDGNEVTRMIAWENRFLTNIVSFRNFSENIEIIECIEKAEILAINRTDFDYLMKSSLNLKSIYADILEEYNALHIKRFEQLNSGNANEKLKYFNQNYAILKNRISDIHLSSFLSISRKTIERVKKN